MKNPGTAAVIALVVGAILFWGVGHIYVGKVLKGIGIMVAGWVIGGLFVLSLLSIIAVRMAGLAMIILFAVLGLGGWIWQTFDAYSLAKQYNDYVRTHGVEPW
jgi:TM2 domain-containing membrane protein YozV